MENRSTINKYFDTERSAHDYIEKYEENKNFFNAILQTGRKEDLEFVLPIKIYKYASSLNHDGQYTNALKAIEEIEKDLMKLHSISTRHKLLNESTTFIKGVCLGRLKKYKESNSEFRKILKVNPDNDKYMSWYKSNLISIVDKYLKTIAILSIFFYLTILTLQFFGIKMPVFVRVIGPIILLTTIASMFLTEKIINKLNLNFKKYGASC